MSDTSRKAATLRLRRLRKWIVCGVVAFAVVWAAWIVATLVLADWKSIDKVGAFGDAMAFVGSIATALALVVAAYSMLLQREDIDQQIEEMRGSKDATVRLACAQEADTRVRKLQALLDSGRAFQAEMMADMESLRREVEQIHADVQADSRAGRGADPNWMERKNSVPRLWRMHRELDGLYQSCSFPVERLEMALLEEFSGMSWAPDKSLQEYVQTVHDARRQWNDAIASRV